MKSLTKDRLLIAAVAAAYILMITVNALANILPIGDMTSGQVSDAYPNLFAPIGFTFSIWSLIYTLLLAFTVYFAAAHWNRGFDGKMYLHRTAILFAMSSLVNGLWILAWHYRIIWLSLFLMGGILYCLIRINLILRDKVLTITENYLVRLPFNVYFGWITVATIANVSVLLVDLEWNRFGVREDIMTSAVLAVGAVIAVASIRTYKNLAFGAVVIWAYVGILAKHMSPLYFDGSYPLIVATLVLLIGVIGGFELKAAFHHS